MARYRTRLLCGLDALTSSIRRRSPPRVGEAHLERWPAAASRGAGDRRPLDEGDAAGVQVVLEQGRVLALEVREPVEVEVGDGSRPPP